MTERASVIEIEELTHNIRRIKIEKPYNYQYQTGQAMKVSVNLPEWKNRENIFTITSIPLDNYLEIIVKILPDQTKILKSFLLLEVGQELIVSEAVGGLKYKGEGVFIAGGVGITPFLALFKELDKKNEIGNNKLIFANRNKSDIFYEKKLTDLLGDNFTNILSEEKSEKYYFGIVDENFIKEHIKDYYLKYFYLCGSQAMMEAVTNSLMSIGVKDEQIIKESF